MTTTMEPAIQELVVVDPRSGVIGAAVAAPTKTEAARVDTLDGKVLALIDNGMGSARVLAGALVDRLRAEYQLTDVILVRKPSVSVPPLAADWAEVVERADVGVSFFGGCGSCSSRTMRDAIEMEWAGIPAVAIIHEALAGSAEAMRKMSKMPEYPLVQVSYPASPTAIWDDEMLASVLDDIVPQVIARLVVTAAP
jgi:hypothetical protein